MANIMRNNYRLYSIFYKLLPKFTKKFTGISQYFTISIDPAVTRLELEAESYSGKS